MLTVQTMLQPYAREARAVFSEYLEKTEIATPIRLLWRYDKPARYAGLCMPKFNTGSISSFVILIWAQDYLARNTRGQRYLLAHELAHAQQVTRAARPLRGNEWHDNRFLESLAMITSDVHTHSIPQHYR